MRDFVFTLFAIVAAYAGFACLALSQRRNWKRALLSGAVPVSTLRATGYILLLSSLIASFAGETASFGIVLWGCLISPCAMAVSFTLAWRPSWIRRFCAPFESSEGVQRK